MKSQRVFIGLLTALLVVAGLNAVSYGRSEAFAADFGKNEPGKVVIADVITKGQTVNGAGSVANLVFRVKSNFYGKSLFNLSEISVIDGAQRLNIQRDVAPLSLMITPDKSELVQNYPNPFNPETTIRYSLEKPANVPLTNYHNVVGSRSGTLVNVRRTALGRPVLRRIGWVRENGRYYVSAGDFQSVKRMLMLK